MVNANTLLTVDAARNWKTFVADYMVLMTAKKANRDLVSGYSVRRVRGAYQIFFGKLSPYAPMTAEQIYEWSQRLPLQWLAGKADDMRADILTGGR